MKQLTRAKAVVIDLVVIACVLGILPSTAAPPDPPSCIACHSNVMSLEVKHHAATSNCQNCHTTHENPQGKERYLLIEQPPALCIRCHDGSNMGHTTKAIADPLYPDRKFNCISCHQPHSSKMPKLFRYDYAKGSSPYGGQQCAVCHWGMIFGPPAPPRPPWNPYPPMGSD